MGTVEFDVVEVVDQIAGAGDRAEGNEGGRRIGNRAGVVELAAEHQPREDEDVLDPFRGTDGDQRRPQGRARRRRCGLLGLRRFERAGLGRLVLVLPDGGMFVCDRLHGLAAGRADEGPDGSNAVAKG